MGAIGADSAVLADHIELVVCASTGENFNRKRIEELADIHWGADPVQVSYAFDILHSRASLLGARYPLNVARGYVVRQRTAPVYEALLSLTRTNWFYARGDVSQLDTTKLFEDITERSLSQFFGRDTCTVNFGWPSQVGRPPEFSPAVAWLAEQIGIPVGTAYRQPRRKDGGVDIVVWRPFADRRPGVPLMLVQATVQTDVVAKARDVDRRVWSGWLAMDIEPLVALAIPGNLNRAEDWNEVSINSLLLDRVRLSDLAPEGDEVLMSLCGSVIEPVQALVMALLEDR